MKSRFALALLACLVLTWSAAIVGAAEVSFPKSTLEVVPAGGKAQLFDIELASRPEQLSQGLMFRRSMAPNAGMLFDFGQPRQVSMWMRNTLIPLDMLFIDERGIVVAVVERAIPMSEEPLGPSATVKAVLELNGGTASRLSIAPGAQVRHAIFGNR